MTPDKGKILIVEDEAVVAKDLEAILSGLEYGVVGCTGNGAEAIRMAESLRPELVLMDIRLRGEIDGIAAAQEMHRRFGTAVVFITAYADGETLARAQQAEPFGYLVKPFSAKAIACTVPISLQRARLDQSLRDANTELERRVEQRTANLRTANQELEKQIAEREQAELLLRETEKLAATGRMAARIAHEINNPLAGIKNSFLLIKDAVAPSHPYHDYVGRIEREIDRIAKIVRQMFDLYRQDEEPASHFSPAAALRDVIALLAGKARESQVSLELAAGDESPQAYLPEGLFRQVMFNIIVNAIEASPLEAPVTVALRVDVGDLVVEVADRGPGIPGEMRGQVFEAFFTTKFGAQRHGLGLGLSTAKSIMDALGGSIEFDSTPSKGTTFRMRFPTTTEPEVFRE